MAVLKGILFVISLWGWLFLTGWACRIKVWFVPIVTAAGLGITLYAGGLFGFLKETAVLLYAAGFAGTVLSFWAVLTRRFTFPKLSMFGFFFASSSVLFAVLIWNLKLLHYDNFSHWAVVVHAFYGSFCGCRHRAFDVQRLSAGECCVDLLRVPVCGPFSGNHAPCP